MSGDVATFPTLYEILEEVRDLVEQSRGRSGSGTWSEAEFSRAATSSARWLINELVSMDGKYQVAETDITVAADAGQIAAASLPADMVGIENLFRIDSQGNNIGVIPPGTLADRGRRMTRVWFPTDHKIQFMLDDHEAMTVRLMYTFKPLPLVHGICEDGGSDSVQLADYETHRTGALIGQTIILAHGTGAGQEGTCLTYDGPTRTVTLDADWTGLSGSSPVSPVGSDTIYTTRPKLPWFAEDAFVYDIACRMLQKLQDERYLLLFPEREKFVKDLKQSVKSPADRQRARRTADHAGFTGFCDPAARIGVRRPGNW